MSELPQWVTEGWPLSKVPDDAPLELRLAWFKVHFGREPEEPEQTLFQGVYIYIRDIGEEILVGMRRSDDCIEDTLNPEQVREIIRSLQEWLKERKP